jgi:hypothetical protein
VQAALTRASDDGLIRAAKAWVESEEMPKAVEAGEVMPVLRELAALAKHATASGHRLYCWVSL